MKQETPERRGPLAWFAKNSVAANTLMIILLVGGWLNLRNIKQEVFPEAKLDKVLINVPYPGASPEEVEQGVLLVIEEAVRGLEDIKEVESTALEGTGVVVVDLLREADPDKTLADVKAAVDRIVSFPEEAERPVVSLASHKNEVLSLIIYGDASEQTLRNLGERTRDELLQDDRITSVEVVGIRPLEVSVEIPQETLRKYDLTLDRVAALIRQASVELPGGAVKTPGGEILLRTDERRDRGQEYEEIVVFSDQGGTQVQLGEIAEIDDGFAETDVEATYNGKRAVMVRIFRTGDQTPLDISAAVRDYAEANAHRLPPGVSFGHWFDSSEMYQQRVDLLVRNAAIGLVLVLLVLGVFLELKLAFWVTLGIPITFVGSLLFLPSTDVSINMISLFAFIVVLGIVVDDAIIVGEAIYRQRQLGKSRLEAAIAGAREVAVPVTFAIVTTILAFMPMLFVPGPMGAFWRVIPITVIIVFLLSLIESLFILPAHLAHSRRAEHGVLGFVSRQQAKFSAVLERFIERIYAPSLRALVKNRYLTLAVAFAVFIASVGLVVGGRVDRTFMPRVDGDVVGATAELPYGTSIERTRDVQRAMLTSAREVMEEIGGEDKVSRGIFAMTGAKALAGFDPSQVGVGGGGSHLAEVAVYMQEADKRGIRSKEFAHRWRQRLEDRAYGLERLTFNFFTGPQAGAPVHVELSHPNTDTLRAVATDLAEKVKRFEGTYDVDDGYELGKPQLDFHLKPAARSLGVTELDLARQLRSAFFGAEAVRQQRGRDEVKTYVRLPRRERESEYFVERLMLRTPKGGEIPLWQAASVERGRAYTEIKRIDGRRAVAVTGEVDQAVGNATKIVERLEKDVLPALIEAHPGLTYQVGGEERERQEAMGSLQTGWLMAIIGMFALLAVVFRSYVQPLIVLLAVPFGFVGALLGHVVMGFDLSLVSIMGVVALSGIVVNDSLLLVVTVNRLRDEGVPLLDAVVSGGARRFRPILLTSLTTFFGLAPMILETSVQAKFLVPMAVSLGFGVMFATLITLVLVPAVYLMIEDVSRGFKAVGAALGPRRSAD